MRLKSAAAFVAAAGLLLMPVTGAVGPAEAKMVCKTHRGKGWGFDQAQAKFQAWEIITQVTGNWPIATDTLKNERYKCKPDGNGVTCYSWMDVCKST